MSDQPNEQLPNSAGIIEDPDRIPVAPVDPRSERVAESTFVNEEEDE